MSTGSLESIVSVLKNRQDNLEVHVEELGKDIANRIKHLTDDDGGSNFFQRAMEQVKAEGQIDTRFNLVDAHLLRIEATMATKDDLVAMENRMASMESRMATMENCMVTMESRMLDAFQQLITRINPQSLPE